MEPERESPNGSLRLHGGSLDSKGNAMIRLAMTDKIAESLLTHLFASDPLEQGAFCLLHQGEGHNCKRLLISDILLPFSRAWEIQTETNLRPSAQWLSAGVSRAVANRTGLLFIHAHPDKAYPLGLSYSDQSAFTSIARTIAPMLDGPFGAVVAHPDGWSGVLWSGN